MSDQETQGEASATTETGSGTESVEAVIERMMPPNDSDEGEKSQGEAEEPRAEKDEDADEAAADADEPGDEDAEEADEPEPDKAEADEDDEDEDEEQDEESMLEHAYEVLLRAKRAPFSVLKSTPKAKLIAWAKQVEEEQANATRGASRPPDAKRDAPDDSKDADSPAEGESDDTWQSKRSALAKKLGLDEETVDAFKPLYDDNRTVKAELAALREEMQARDGRETINREMRRLTESYPTLKSNEKKAEKVLDEARTLVAGLKARGKRVDPEAVFNKAAQTVLGKAPRSDLAALRRNGFATMPQGTREGLDTTKSTTEYWDKAVTHAMNGRGDLISRLRPPPQEEPKRRR